MLLNREQKNYTKDLMFEFEQAMDEGKDVAVYQDICQKTAQNYEDFGAFCLASQLRENMLKAPMRKDYPYAEPSDLEGIRKERKEKPFEPSFSFSKEELAEHFKGAWVGRISGCLLGKPVEGMKKELIDLILTETGNKPLHRLIEYRELPEAVLQEFAADPEYWKNRAWGDLVNGCEPIDDDTNYTVMTMKMMKQYGKDITSQNILDTWLADMPIHATFTAERATYRNAVMGLDASETAVYFNPYREWIGAQIRGDFYGYAYLGNPTLAAETAYRDACISHTKNGIYGEMMMAAVIAAAPCKNIRQAIQTGLDQIPQKSRLYEKIQLVLQRYEEKKTYQQMIDEIHTLFNEASLHGWCHTVANAMIVVTALLWGEGDIGKSICMAVEAAFDTDCNGATVGSILGTMYGFDAVPERFYKCYDLNLSTSIMGYSTVKVEDLVRETLSIYEKLKA